MSLRDRVREAVTRADDPRTPAQQLYLNELTKAALAEAKARGVKLGRPSNVPPELRGRIVEMRQAGMSLQGIADRLAAEGERTAQGGICENEGGMSAYLICSHPGTGRKPVAPFVVIVAEYEGPVIDTACMWLENGEPADVLDARELLGYVSADVIELLDPPGASPP